MRDVLVVDDDFMVAEIHRRFVDRVDGFAPPAWHEPAPRL
jgi:response regulator of citrate/malate metabolism